MTLDNKLDFQKHLETIFNNAQKQSLRGDF